jgi:hypothetical protein
MHNLLPNLAIVKKAFNWTVDDIWTSGTVCFTAKVLLMFTR